MKGTPKPPPFPVCCVGGNNPIVRPGAVGEVVATREGSGAWCLTLDELIERILLLPDVTSEDATLLRAFLDGDRSLALVERMRARHRAEAHRECITPIATLAAGWGILAALEEAAGATVRRDRALRWALEALEHAEAERPTIPCAPPGETWSAAPDLDWDNDPADVAPADVAPATVPAGPDAIRRRNSDVPDACETARGDR